MTQKATPEMTLKVICDVGKVICDVGKVICDVGKVICDVAKKKFADPANPHS